MVSALTEPESQLPYPVPVCGDLSMADLHLCDKSFCHTQAELTYSRIQNSAGFRLSSEWVGHPGRDLYS